MPLETCSTADNGIVLIPSQNNPAILASPSSTTCPVHGISRSHWREHCTALHDSCCYPTKTAIFCFSGKVTDNRFFLPGPATTWAKHARQGYGLEQHIVGVGYRFAVISGWRLHVFSRPWWVENLSFLHDRTKCPRHIMRICLYIFISFNIYFSPRVPQRSYWNERIFFFFFFFTLNHNLSGTAVRAG